jgi:hypothetical protein
MATVCAICSRPAAATFGGFPFCMQHTRMARKERERRRQLPIAFDVLEAAHAAAPKDEDGDASHAHDPLVAAWLGDVWQRGKSAAGGD